MSDSLLCSCLIHPLSVPHGSFINSHPFLPSLCLLVLFLLGVFQLGDLRGKLCQLSGLHTGTQWKRVKSAPDLRSLCSLRGCMCVRENVCVCVCACTYMFLCSIMAQVNCLSIQSAKNVKNEWMNYEIYCQAEFMNHLMTSIPYQPCFYLRSRFNHYM